MRLVYFLFMPCYKVLSRLHRYSTILYILKEQKQLFPRYISKELYFSKVFKDRYLNLKVKDYGV